MSIETYIDRFANAPTFLRCIPPVDGKLDDQYDGPTRIEIKVSLICNFWSIYISLKSQAFYILQHSLSTISSRADSCPVRLTEVHASRSKHPRISKNKIKNTSFYEEIRILLVYVLYVLRTGQSVWLEL